MRKTTIALLCVLTMSRVAVNHERDFIRFFRQLFRHFISATEADEMKPPTGTPCTTTTGC